MSIAHADYMFHPVSISAIPRDAEIFCQWLMDCAEPFLPGENVQFNYALILVDSACRYPVVMHYVH